MVFQGIPPNKIDTEKPHSARMYDYLLGGRDNYEVDRSMAEDLLVALPTLRHAARENRSFLHRAVRTIVRTGVRQIIDIGTGIPTSPNTHEVAQQIDPATRVVYIDNDPIVQGHAHARLTRTPNTTFVLADFRNPAEILEHPDVRAMIDFEQPMALTLVALLHWITDAEDPAACIAGLRDAMAPGSYLALTHSTTDDVEDDSDGALKTFRQAGLNVRPRNREEVLRLFDGYELLEPGLSTVSAWRPDPDTPSPWPGIYAAVGIKR